MTFEELDISYGKSLYILGASVNGPTNTPVLIKDILQALNLFGPSELVNAWHEAYQVAGDDVNIYLVKVNGEPSTLNISGVDLHTSDAYDAISLVSYQSGELWNNTSIVVSKDYLKIVNPDEVGGGVTIYFDSYPTTGSITNAINYAFGKGAIGVYATCAICNKPYSDIVRAYEYRLNEPIYMLGGDDNLLFNKNELHHKLNMTYNILEGQAIDVITVLGAYFDDVSPLAYYGKTEYGELFYSSNRDYLEIEHDTLPQTPATFHGQLIEFCKKQMQCSIMTHGIIAFNPVENIEDILNDNAYITKAVSSTCLFDRHDLTQKTSETNIEDNGRFITITLGEFEYTGINGNTYYRNAHVGYGALVASTLTPQSLTNSIVPNIPTLRYYLEDDELVLLAKMGITTFRKSILKDAIVVSNGVTAALNTSPYHVVSNMRMVQLILNAYNNSLSKYVGEDVDLLIKNKSIEKEAEAIAKVLIEAKIVNDIKPNCKISRMGVAVVHLEILPIYSTEYVSATNTIKL